jgi:hypothetical protein
MHSFAMHWYQHAETYSIALVVFTVPFAYLSLLYFLIRHYVKMVPPEKNRPNTEGTSNE